MKRTTLVVTMILLGFLLVTVAVGADELKREKTLIKRLAAPHRESENSASQTAQSTPTREEVMAAAKMIDDYLEEGYKQRNLRPNAFAGDETFLRRAYLDIAGRIPTGEETLAFLNDSSVNKRADLIDQLLDSEAYVHHNYTFLADLLRVQTVGGRGLYGGIAYANWLKQSLRENKPYDQLVFELITANGYPWEDGAVGFYLRDEGMPLDHMANTVQIFLGTSLQCAQCHDHPFDKWSQYEFYEMAAFTAGVRTRMPAPNLRQAMQQARGDRASMIALRRLARPLSYGVVDTQRPIRLPHDYQYADASPNEIVEPYPIFGEEVFPNDQQTLREAYASWMIQRENDRFAATIANRLWKKIFGLGLIEPPDQMTDSTKPVYPALMEFLSHKMAAWDYDIKQFQRMLLHTQLYQRVASTEDPPEDEPYGFTGPLLRRMTAEQMWDSLITLCIPEPDYRRGPVSDGNYFRRIQALRDATPRELIQFATEQSRFQQQRRALMNQIRQAREDGDERLAIRLIQQRNNLQPPAFIRGMRSMMSDRDTRDDGMASDLDNPYSMPRRNPDMWRGYSPGLVRASELPSPVNPNHFLRQFGQSDRDIVNNASSEPHILQVLAMFNGPYFEQAITPRSQMMRIVQRVDEPIEKVRAIFLSVLNREPNRYELDAIERLAWIEGSDPDYAQIVWALLNTREFSFVR